MKFIIAMLAGIVLGSIAIFLKPDGEKKKHHCWKRRK